MPQQPSGFDFSGIPRATPATPQPVPGFDFSGIPPAPPAIDTRSGFARAVDVATTPMVSPATARRASDAIAGTGERAPVTGGLFDAYSPGALFDVAKAFFREPVTTARAMAGGIVEGMAANLTAPLDAALVAIGGLGKAARPVVVGSLKAIAEAERAIVAARASGRMNEIPGLVRELNSARREGDRALALAKVSRAAEVGAGVAMTGRGVERIADADAGDDVAMGVGQIAGGVLGVKTASPRVTMPPPFRMPPPQLAGEVPPSFRVTPEGVAGRPSDIPLTAAPDGSFVRAEPGQFATRDPRALLPQRAASADEFVAGPEGIARRGDVPTAVPGVRLEDFNFSGIPPAAPPVTGKGKGRKPKSEAVVVPAAIADREPGGGPIYSGDPRAVSVRALPLDAKEQVELRAMLAEMESMEFTKHTFLEEPIGRGGALEIVPGGGGAPVYQHIASLYGREPGRDAVKAALQKMLDGDPTIYGPAIREAARMRLRGEMSRTLPEDAGVRFGRQSGAMDDEDFARFGETVDDLSTLPPGGEPGELGRVSPFLAAHMGGGVAGAVYGGATGEDTKDRVTRAALFGGLGAVVPGLLRPRGGGGGPVARVLQSEVRAAADAIPTTARPAGAPRRPMADPLRGTEVFLEKFPPEFRPGIRDVLERNQGFQAQRGGVVKQGDVEKMAEAIGVDVARRVKPGTAMNASGIRAHVDAMAGAQAKVTELSARLARGANTDADVIALEVAKAELGTVAASIMGARSEAGRALAQFKVLARVLETRNPELIGDAARLLRGDAERFAREFSALGDDPLARFQWLRDQEKPGLREKARQLYLSNILSGIKTHERNFLGNTFNMVTNLVVAPASAAVDAARVAARGGQRSIYLDELPGQVVASFVGMRKGFDEALFSLRNGVNRSALTQSLSAAEAGKLDVPRVEFAGGGANPINWPGRALDGADQFFRAIARESESYGAAHAAAKREGLRGDAFADRVAELRAGIGPLGERIQEQADTYARRAVFQEKAGPIVGHLQALAKKYPELSFVIPFMRTPANIFKQGAAFSPAGFLMKAARAEGREGSQAQARAVLGSIGLGGLAYLLATKQLEVSGAGPKDPAARAQLMESGWRPNSVRVGDSWSEISLFQPISVPLLVMANAFDTWREVGAKDEDTAAKVLATALRSVRSSLDMSFLGGVADLFELLETRSMETASRYLGRQAHSFTPMAGTQRTVTSAVDPMIRAPKGFVESFKASVPGLSSSVEPRIDRLGNEVRRPGGPLRRAADPFNVSPVTRDPVVLELGRLGVKMGTQTARMGLPNDGKPSRAEDLEIRKAKGDAVARVLARLIAAPGYQRLSDHRKREALNQAIAKTRAAVTRQYKPRVVRRLAAEQAGAR